MSILLLSALLSAGFAHAEDLEVAKGKSVVKCVAREGGAGVAADAAGELTSVLNNLQVQVESSDNSMGIGFNLRYTVRPPFSVSQPSLTLVEKGKTGSFVATLCVTLTKQ